jgi:membrane protein YqaA with SNARE-associated domain
MPEAPMTAPLPSPPQTPGGPPAPLVPRWHLLRRLYDWMMGFAHSPYATVALCLFSFTEAIFFPIPPFVLQIPLTLERRTKTWYYALITTVSSVLGGMVGYALGWLFQDQTRRAINWLFGEAALPHAEPYLRDLWVLTIGAIAVHPFKLFTIAAGLLDAPFWQFVIASIVGRAFLFFAIAVMLWFFGPPVRRFVEKYFNILTIVFGALLLAIVVAVKFL